jgi:hypothetical protein
MAGVPKVRRGSKGSDNLPTKPERVKLKLSLDRETVRLLRLEAFGRDCPVGLVVDELVRSTPQRFVLTDRGSRVPGGHRAAEGQGSSEVPGHVGPARPLGLLSDAG